MYVMWRIQPLAQLLQAGFQQQHVAFEGDFADFYTLNSIYIF